MYVYVCHIFCEVFLSSELQAAQIVKSRPATDQQQGESPVQQELQAICETLKLPPPRGQGVAHVFSEVESKVCLNLRYLFCGGI